MSIPSTPASSKQPGPLSTPTNTLTPTPSESTPSTPEAVLVQVDHLSALPQELQNEIMDWVAPTLLSAEAKALGLTSKTLHQTLENHKEMRAPDLVKFSLRRFDQALAYLPSMASRNSVQNHFIQRSEQLNATLQKCAAETGPALGMLLLMPVNGNNLLNEEGLAAFHNYAGRQLSISGASDDNNVFSSN